METTFGIIKPNAITNGHKYQIAEIIEKNDLTITEARFIFLKKEDAETFYAEHKEKPFFDGLIRFMTSAPILAMKIEGDNAVSRYRKLIGDTDPAKADKGTLRNLFAKSKSENSVHGSDSSESALREIEFFFGKDAFKTS